MVDGRDVVEIDAELASRMGCPFAILEGDFVTGVVDDLAVLEGLQEQSEAGGDTEGDEWAKFHRGLPVFLFPEVGHVSGAVVFALPVFEQFEV